MTNKINNNKKLKYIQIQNFQIAVNFIRKDKKNHIEKNVILNNLYRVKKQLKMGKIITQIQNHLWPIKNM